MSLLRFLGEIAFFKAIIKMFKTDKAPVVPVDLEWERAVNEYIHSKECAFNVDINDYLDDIHFTEYDLDDYNDLEDKDEFDEDVDNILADDDDYDIDDHIDDYGSYNNYDDDFDLVDRDFYDL